MDKESIVQNLKDANCSSSIIEEFFKLEEVGNVKEQLRLLSKHKSSLLETLHECQKEIDCLDYLVFSITQNLERS